MRALSHEPVNGRWLLTGLVGRGSTATVFRAFDLVTERQVALKAFPPGVPGGSIPWSGAAQRRALREFLDQSRLRHPNLVESYEVGIAESGPLPAESPFFTMELLEPGPIPAAPHPPDLAKLARIALDVLSALECVHAHGLIHNDVKPSNLFLERPPGARERAKLGDFGLASRGPGSRRGRRSVTGTLHYVAPETIAGARGDARSDLYSLGVLLFEALTGALPFDGSDPYAVLEWHLKGERSGTGSAGALMPALARLISRSLQVRPEDRYRDAREAREEISSAAPSPACALEGGEEEVDGPLIGRTMELRRLQSWLGSAVRAGGRFDILGDRGSGLSRFAREAALAGRSRGWCVHAWRCDAADPPFAALRAPLRELILGGCGASLAARKPTEDEVLALLGGPALWSAPAPVTESARVPLASAIGAFLSSRALPRPLLLVIEDYEAADEGTRLVVDALGPAPQGGGPRPLIVTASRLSAAAEVAREAHTCWTIQHAPTRRVRAPKAVGGIGDRSRHDSRRPLARPTACRRMSRGHGCDGERSRSDPEALAARCAGCARARRTPVPSLRLGSLELRQARRLVAGLPCVDRALKRSEAMVLIERADRMPGRLVRLVRLVAVRQIPLFPPLAEPSTIG